MSIQNFKDTYDYTIDFCKFAHGEQKRKYTNEPYWTHPFNVAYRLYCLDMPYSVIEAALLHDVVEDTRFALGDIVLNFGIEVATLVSEVTDVSRPEDGNRAVRKQIDLDHIAKASYYGKCIKLADMIDNTSSIVKHDMGFARVYLKEKEKALAVLTEGHPLLVQYAADLLSVSKVAVDYWEEEQ